MKLLFDQNLSDKLVISFRNEFPNSRHLKRLGLSISTDEDLWNFAKENNFIIISKDYDFHQMSFLFGMPPKFIWLKVGNCSTRKIETVVRNHLLAIKLFATDAEAAMLVLE